MKRLAIIAISLLALSVAMEGQNYASSKKDKIIERVHSYQNDDVVGQISGVLAMFDRAQIPDSRVLSKTYAHGIVYILSENADNNKGIRTLPAVNAAVFQCFERKMGVLRMLPGEGVSTGKRPLTTYVQQYLRGNAVNDAYSSRYILEYLGMKVKPLPYINNGDEFIIPDDNDIYVRQYGNDILAVTANDDFSEILIYRFKVSQAMSTSAQLDDVNDCTIMMSNYNQPKQKSKYPFQREYVVEDTPSTRGDATTSNSAAIENDQVSEAAYREDLSQAIETAINNKSVKTFTGLKNMYIVSSGLFGQNLGVKFNGDAIHIQSVPSKGNSNYIQFLSTTFDGRKNHDAQFKFGIPCSNVYFTATLKHDQNKWVVKEMLVTAE